MLHWWLLPVLAVFLMTIGALYLTVRLTGGTGIRTDGRTLLHKHDPEDDSPPR